MSVAFTLASFSSATAASENNPCRDVPRIWRRPLAHQEAVFAHQRGQVRDRAERDQIEQIGELKSIC